MPTAAPTHPAEVLDLTLVLTLKMENPGLILFVHEA
jgi:hypothetical protein